MFFRLVLHSPYCRPLSYCHSWFSCTVRVVLFSFFLLHISSAGSDSLMMLLVKNISVQALWNCKPHSPWWRHNKVMHCIIFSSYFFWSGSCFWGKVGKEMSRTWLWILVETVIVLHMLMKTCFLSVCLEIDRNISSENPFENIHSNYRWNSQQCLRQGFAFYL